MPRAKKNSNTPRRALLSPAEWESHVVEDGSIPCPKENCTMTFTDAEELLYHVLEHITTARRQPGATRYVCIWRTAEGPCGRAAIQKSNMKTHVKTHLQIRDLTCPHLPIVNGVRGQCERKFVDPGSLTRHRKMCHGYVPEHKDSVDPWVGKNDFRKPVVLGGDLEWRYGEVKKRTPEPSSTPSSRSQSTHPDLQPRNWKQWMDVEGPQQPTQGYVPGPHERAYAEPIRRVLYDEYEEDSVRQGSESGYEYAESSDSRDAQSDILGYPNDPTYTWPTPGNTSMGNGYLGYGYPTNYQERYASTMRGPHHVGYLPNYYYTAAPQVEAHVPIARYNRASYESYQPEPEPEPEYAQASSSAETPYVYGDNDVTIHPRNFMSEQDVSGKHFWRTLFPAANEDVEDAEDANEVEGGQRIRGWFNVCV